MIVSTEEESSLSSFGVMESVVRTSPLVHGARGESPRRLWLVAITDSFQGVGRMTRGDGRCAVRIVCPFSANPFPDRF